jgi:arogenate dehydrogenase (NADP+)
VALISHLPVLVSAALLQAADRGAAGELADLVRTLASSGFADTTRVGGGNPQLGALMAHHNRQALLAALGDYRLSLERFENLVRAADWGELERQLQGCQELRPSFLQP